MENTSIRVHAFARFVAILCAVYLPLHHIHESPSLTGSLRFPQGGGDVKITVLCDTCARLPVTIPVIRPPRGATEPQSMWPLCHHFLLYTRGSSLYLEVLGPPPQPRPRRQRPCSLVTSLLWASRSPTWYQEAAETCIKGKTS